ncbi:MULTISPECIES: phosphatase PAP2 family protein [unclassified Streptomyces]|uniref:phosphatase PAP2 family protein n=1 Tax=unclassified Streptomyces TaxID=2593676 RepID=UPI002E80484E|nr:phosphatase PAP2 family protein [Streptomyces sp. NBC_00589]WTI35892.1 phosphatase PAP2 family protein [Streptomyces sp. NBC_00775]WUB30434.1 phosphatase PAP2 family protein [Streptomyces sp. NBC_00589]
MGDTGSRPPQLRPGRALAHTPGASGSGSPHRSDSRPPQTPRGARHSDLDGRLGTTPPVPGRPTFLLLGLPALLFALITWQVAAHGPLARADERLSGSIVRPSRFYELLADLGNIAVAVPVLALVLAYVAVRAHRAGTDRWWLPSTAAAVLMAAVPALIVPLKELVARPGPPVMGPGTGFYPSGHTATAAIAYGAATLLLLPWLRTAYARRGLAITCLLLNALVAFGLIRRGYHWPLDVVASWCLCAVLLSSLWLFLSRSTRRSSSGTPSSSTGPS